MSVVCQLNMHFRAAVSVPFYPLKMGNWADQIARMDTNKEAAHI